MIALNSDELNIIAGGGHDLAEACLVGGGVGAAAGSFFSPAGSAAGGLIGCGAGIIFYLL